jgi:hypothetical protein
MYENCLIECKGKDKGLETLIFKEHGFDSAERPVDGKTLK